MKAAGQLIEGTAYLEQGKANKRIAERNALYAERDASAEASKVREDVRKTMGAQLAAQGASGFEVGAGSALDQLVESQVNGMLDVMTVRRQGATKGAAYRYRGAMAEAEGEARAATSYFGAAQSLVGSATDYAAQKGR